MRGRPVTTALFFSLLKDPGLIRFGHALVSFAAWAYFARQFSRLLPETTARLAFAVLFVGVLGADVMLWNRLLISESLSISLQVTLLGFFARLIRDEPVSVWLGVAAIVPLIFFTTQTRDSNVLLILGRLLFLPLSPSSTQSRRTVSLRPPPFGPLPEVLLCSFMSHGTTADSCKT
mgnify:CR=1 FL=1